MGGESHKPVGIRPVSITINTFGVPERARLGNQPRHHRIDTLKRRSIQELVESHRGCSIAALQAHCEGEGQDVRIALTRGQQILAEIMRRVCLHGVHVTTNDTDHFSGLSETSDAAA